MSYLLEVLGRGLEQDVEDVLRSHCAASPSRSIEELQQARMEDPDDDAVVVELGLAYLREGRLPEAADALADAVRGEPDSVAARAGLGIVSASAGDLDGAVTHLRIAEELLGDEPTLPFARGLCLEKLSQPESAAQCYRRAIEADGAYAPARHRLAAVSLFRERTDEAVEQYLALRQAEPQDSWTRTSLGHLLYRAGRYDEAAEEFEAAIAMEPENWALVDDEVEALVADDRIHDAIARLQEMIAEQGPFADLHVRLADLYDRVDDDDQATKHYLLALEIQPSYLEATVKLGTHHLQFGRWEEAAEVFYQAAELNDRVLLNYVGMGVAQFAAGKRDDALNSFDLAAAVEPNSTLLLTEMARLQLKAALGDAFARSFAAIHDQTPPELDLDNETLIHKQLERHAEQVGRTPNHADLRYRYGVLLRSEDRLADAKEQFRKAVHISPSYVQAIVKLGITLQELGEVDAAIETCRMALALRQDAIDLHYKLGLLYTDREAFTRSVKQMEQAAGGGADSGQIRAGLALSLQNMGLMDRAAATWRSLYRVTVAGA